MRAIALVSATLVLLCATALASPLPETSSERDMRRATAYVEKGRTQLSTVPGLDSNSSRLDVLDRARYFLGEAREIAAKGEGADFARLLADAERELVRALDAQAEIYYERTSLELAKKRNLEALSLDPHDARALNLAGIMHCDEREPQYVGTAAGERIGRRIRIRRAEIGIPLRDRGVRIGR